MQAAEPLQQINRTCVRLRGRTLLYFGGCDYFRLSRHPKILQAVKDGLRRFGLNVAASRVTTGNHELYPTLERELARFFGAESAMLANSGYVTNLLVAQSLAGQFSHALVDERAHFALQDAAQMLNCPVLTFQHRNPDDFAVTLQRCGRAARPIALTDGMFSRDGSVAPLSAYLKLLPHDGLLVVDDAHGVGTLGKTGKGSVELENIPRDRVVQSITLSKAFGVYGGAILCSRRLRGKLAGSRMFVGSTPLPLPLAFAARQSLQILRQDRSLRQRLEANGGFVKSTLRQAGFGLPESPGPIVPLHFDDAKQVVRLKRALLAAGILPPLINYHGGPAHGYFRFIISSEHTQPQLRLLVRTLTPFAPAKS
jgi:8-amino-7-oxononanoate synthase